MGLDVGRDVGLVFPFELVPSFANRRGRGVDFAVGALHRAPPDPCVGLTEVSSVLRRLRESDEQLCLHSLRGDLMLGARMGRDRCRSDGW